MIYCFADWTGPRVSAPAPALALMRRRWVPRGEVLDLLAYPIGEPVELAFDPLLEAQQVGVAMGEQTVRVLVARGRPWIVERGRLVR